MKNLEGSALHALRDLASKDASTAVGVSKIACWMRRHHRKNGGSFVHPALWYKIARKQLYRSLIKKRVILYYKHGEQRFALANMEQGDGDYSTKEYVKRQLTELYERKRFRQRKLNKNRRNHIFKRKLFKNKTNNNRYRTKKILKTKSAQSTRLKSDDPVKCKSNSSNLSKKIDKASTTTGIKIFGPLEQLKDHPLSENIKNNLKRKLKKRNLKTEEPIETPPIKENKGENMEIQVEMNDPSTKNESKLNDANDELKWNDSVIDFTKSLATLKPLGWSKTSSFTNIMEPPN